MSFIVRCDTCGRRALCGFSDGPVIPAAWKTFKLSDWEAHACSEDCFERLKTQTTDEPTPTSSNGMRLP